MDSSGRAEERERQLWRKTSEGGGLTISWSPSRAAAGWAPYSSEYRGLTDPRDLMTTGLPPSCSFLDITNDPRGVPTSVSATLTRPLWGGGGMPGPNLMGDMDTGQHIDPYGFSVGGPAKQDLHSYPAGLDPHGLVPDPLFSRVPVDTLHARPGLVTPPFPKAPLSSEDLLVAVRRRMLQNGGGGGEVDGFRGMGGLVPSPLGPRDGNMSGEKRNFALPDGYKFKLAPRPEGGHGGAEGVGISPSSVNVELLKEENERLRQKILQMRAEKHAEKAEYGPSGELLQRKADWLAEALYRVAALVVECGGKVNIPVGKMAPLSLSEDLVTPLMALLKQVQGHDERIAQAYERLRLLNVTLEGGDIDSAGFVAGETREFRPGGETELFTVRGAATDRTRWATPPRVGREQQCGLVIRASPVRPSRSVTPSFSPFGARGRAKMATGPKGEETDRGRGAALGYGSAVVVLENKREQEIQRAREEEERQRAEAQRRQEEEEQAKSAAAFRRKQLGSVFSAGGGMAGMVIRLVVGLLGGVLS
uniref:Uncharacterized protein n=1 Tax=Chromera velia CCMP2878 TaxID=1169474 RepID=A0A0G4IE99_9ALVE|eukprot:Cvel_13611.t1-p1 / transcript=Cvel_13611.t1 / gene=Cvel_13611 / organism=Chromera_velia_CCMP2878 / gene_product=hypothetical protein / transcript_product=hypothetical protein / location=Cvel_scaffold937:26968-33235(-) / protein_length=533 / sequence_SO=supercontig / SO=protein_coding / is_pseudo=false